MDSTRGAVFRRVMGGITTHQRQEGKSNALENHECLGKEFPGLRFSLERGEMLDIADCRK